MARVLLTHSYLYRSDPKQWADQRPYPPLGTLLAAAVLRDAGHDVRVFDTGLCRSSKELDPVLLTWEPEVLVIHDDGFNYLTKMCLTVMREAAFRMIQAGRSSECFIVVNSSDATDHFADYLRAGADAVILGESEMTLKEMLDRWSGRSRWQEVHGIAWLEGDDVIRTAPRPVMRDLDSLPLPAWDLIDLEPYRVIWERSQGIFSLNMATTRGCPFKCNWCAKPIYGNRYNSRTPEHVVQEIELLLKDHGPGHIWFADDIFGLKPGWVQRFREVLEDRGVTIRYKIQSRVDLLLENDTIDALVDSGLEEVWVGAESGSQRILDAMDKGIRVEQIHEATDLLRSKGVRVCFFLQFGYLDETEEDVESTIRMVEELLPDDIGVSISYPLPGTRFHEKVKADLVDKANWTDSDDLAMMFRNRHRPAYYKKLHRYVHKRYRRKQALAALAGLSSNLSSATLKRSLSMLYYVPATIAEGHGLRKMASHRAE
ncbi:MAG: B12-binding domain-containing radical SAM protein [Flavobacteriales bacterium]|nr:B12-binding domain-containing radical SAM protein [Flavobacteriales bacterium]